MSVMRWLRPVFAAPFLGLVALTRLGGDSVTTAVAILVVVGVVAAAALGIVGRLPRLATGILFLSAGWGLAWPPVRNADSLLLPLASFLAFFLLWFALPASRRPTPREAGAMARWLEGGALALRIAVRLVVAAAAVLIPAVWQRWLEPRFASSYEAQGAAAALAVGLAAASLILGFVFLRLALTPRPVAVATPAHEPEAEPA